MARIKGGLNAKKKHNRVLKMAKGYRGARSKQYRVAKQSVMRALTSSYAGRKQRKRQFRQLWIARINAAARINGLSYSKVAFLSTDRLRVHITNHCCYKDSGVGCKFCNMCVDHDEITLDDIREVVGAYHRECKEVSHYLVGGQSDGGGHAEEKLIKTVEVIREISPQAKIYVMILPCSQECLDRLIASGVTEIGHNIEIFDADCAVKYMPGKGAIPREMYFKALSSAYFRSSVPGNIRSLVVVGLEKEESMYNGIRRLAEQNIQPILSVFRPLPETELKEIGRAHV